MGSPEKKPEHDPANWSPELQAQIQEISEDLTKQHAEILRWGLVVWTGGNVSARVPGYDLLVIKPSGLSYDELTPESMVVCDLFGNVVRGRSEERRVGKECECRWTREWVQRLGGRCRVGARE